MKKILNIVFLVFIMGMISTVVVAYNFLFLTVKLVVIPLIFIAAAGAMLIMLNKTK